MSDIIGNLIDGSFALLILVVGARLNNKLNKVKDQVVNNHIDPVTKKPINLREEADERHSENSKKLDGLAREFRGMNRSILAIWERLDSNTEDIHNLEITQQTTPHPTKRKR